MTIEITNYGIEDGVVSIYGTDCSEEHLQWLERGREDELRELEFAFDTHDSRDLTYLSTWLHKQKVVREQQPRTWGDALRCVVGTFAVLNGKYMVRD